MMTIVHPVAGKAAGLGSRKDAREPPSRAGNVTATTIGTKIGAARALLIAGPATTTTTVRPVVAMAAGLATPRATRAPPSKVVRDAVAAVTMMRIVAVPAPTVAQRTMMTIVHPEAAGTAGGSAIPEATQRQRAAAGAIANVAFAGCCNRTGGWLFTDLVGLSRGC